MRRLLRRFLTWLFVVALGSIFLALLSEWAIEVLRDKGYYDNAGQTWDRAVSAVLEFIVSPVPLSGLSLLTGLVGGMWLDQFLLKRERQEPPAADAGPDERAQLDDLISEAYKSLGMAIGNGSPLQHQLTVSTVEPLFLQMRRRENMAIPDLRRDGEEAGNLRALLFLNYVVPTLRLLDFDAARERSAEIVPTLNAMSVRELRDKIGPSGGLAPFYG